MKLLRVILSLCLTCSSFAAPRLAVNADGIVFGEVSVGSNVVGRTELRNTGNSIISVSRIKACCGAKAELSAMKIPPDGSAILSVSLTPHDAGTFTKSIQISCDDPERPIVSVPVSGVAVASKSAGNYRISPCENTVRLALGILLYIWFALFVWHGCRCFTLRYCFDGISRIALGGIFVYAGALKFCDVETFSGLLSRYEMLPEISLPFFALAIPVVECVIGLLLAVPRFVRFSAAAVSAMLVVFIVALSQAAVRGLDVSCGCFGGISSEGLLSAILRDVFMLFISLRLMLCSKGNG